MTPCTVKPRYKNFENSKKMEAELSGKFLKRVILMKWVNFGALLS
jgi:hypothetical protein